MQPRIRIKSDPPVVNKPSPNSPRDILINTVYHLLVKNKQGRGGGLIEGGGLFDRGGGGLNREFTVSYHE